jgi:hypothetical protein
MSSPLKIKYEFLTFNHPPCSYFLILAKVVLLKVFHPPKICQNTKFYGPKLIMQVLHPPQ